LKYEQALLQTLHIPDELPDVMVDVAYTAKAVQHLQLRKAPGWHKHENTSQPTEMHIVNNVI